MYAAGCSNSHPAFFFFFLLSKRSMTLALALIWSVSSERGRHRRPAGCLTNQNASLTMRRNRRSFPHPRVVAFGCGRVAFTAAKTTHTIFKYFVPKTCTPAVEHIFDSKAFHDVKPHRGAVFPFSRSHGAVRCGFYIVGIVPWGSVRFSLS